MRNHPFLSRHASSNGSAPLRRCLRCTVAWLLLTALAFCFVSCTPELYPSDSSSGNPSESDRENPSATPSATPAASGGSGSLEGDPTVISFDTLCSHYELRPQTVCVAKGTAPGRLPVPTRENYTFAGWFRDKDCQTPFPETEIVNENLLLYAKWNYTPDSLATLTDPVTVQYLCNGGTLPELPDEAVAVSKGDPIFHPKPQRAGYAFAGWYFDSSFQKEAYNSPWKNNERLFAKWKPLYQKDGMTLPVIAIQTENAQEIHSRSTYLPCTVFAKGGGTDLPDVSAQVRGRGNSTWTQFEKKSFRLKFDKKTDLFGMGSARNFLLISNSFDQSLLRNYTAYTLAGKLGNPYTTQCRFVHLYVNKDYRGVYLVTEHTEVAENRVELNNGKAEGNDVGFLIEFGGEIDVKDKKYFLLPPVEAFDEVHDWGNKLGKIKYPEGKDCTEAQLAYISDYITRVNQAIFERDFATFSELCDVDSFLECFVFNELVYPCDWGYNFFMYKKPGEKLCIGPYWDYDQSAGNSTHGGMGYDQWNTPSTHLWFRALRKTPEFFALAREYYIEHAGILRSVTDIVSDAYAAMQTDIALNYERWPEIGQPHWRSIPEQVAFQTQKEHVDFYIQWLKNRIAWLEAKEQFSIA